MSDNISKIKERLDIVDVISGYLKLHKAGVNYKGRCPFHNEKTASFFVSPERQIWHCFGCGKGGDSIGFVKELEGVEFPEALRILAAKAGIELDFDAGQREARDERSKLFDICEASTRFFQKQLTHSNTGKKAMEYLKGRGLQIQTIEDFRLGFAPNDWEVTGAYLKSLGYSEPEIIAAGMGIKRDGKAGFYDRFRSRIIFPIADINGRVVGFTGRVFSVEGGPASGGGEEIAKYINSPQTQIYDKSTVLYGLNRARTNIKSADRCLLVEGNMDVIMSHQAGVDNTVGTSGTAMTPSHLKLLSRYTDKLDFCFDTDQAGAMATRRGIGLALAGNFNIRVVQIKDKECKDPADYVKKYGKKWIETVKDSKPVLEYYFEKAKESYEPNSSVSKKNLIIYLAPFIKRLASQIERTHWISQLALFLRVSEQDIKADIQLAKDDLDQYTAPQEQKPVSRETKKTTFDFDLLEEAVLSLILKDPVLFKEEQKNIPPDCMTEQLSDLIKKIYSKDLKVHQIEKMIEKLPEEEKMKMEFALLKSQEFWNGFEEDELRVEFGSLIMKLKQRGVTSQLAALQFDIKDAEQKGDREQLKKLAAKFSKLTGELAQIYK